MKFIKKILVLLWVTFFSIEPFIQRCAGERDVAPVADGPDVNEVEKSQQPKVYSGDSVAKKEKAGTTSPSKSDGSATKNKYSPPVDTNNLTKKAVTSEKKDTKKPQTPQTPPKLNIDMNSKQKPPEPPSNNKNYEFQDSTATRKVKGKTEKNVESKNEDDQNEFPNDLPDVDENEVNLPTQAVYETKDDESNKNILITIAAWGLIVVGLLAFIYIILSSRTRRTNARANLEDIPKNKKEKKKKGKLLPDKFYKD